MFPVEPSLPDGWEAFPTAVAAAGHALRELKQGQLNSAAAAAAGGSAKEGFESSPSAPRAEEGWDEAGAQDAADLEVHRGLVDLERPRWLPDSCASGCGGCQRAFQPLARLRHHCRMCGRVFCHACCHKRLLLPPKYNSRCGVRTTCPHTLNTPESCHGHSAMHEFVVMVPASTDHAVPHDVASACHPGPSAQKGDSPHRAT